MAQKALEKARKNVQKAYDDIACLGDLPAEFDKEKQEHFTLVFRDVPLQKRSPGSAQQTSAQTSHIAKLRKGHKAYQNILRQLPHCLLAFVLAISPRSGYDVPVPQFIASFKCPYPMELNANARKTLESFAIEEKFHQDPQFLKWIKLLFERPAKPKKLLVRAAPNAIRLEALRTILADRYYKAFQCSPSRIEEQKDSQMDVENMTRCASVFVSGQPTQDIRLELRVKLDDGLVEELCPAPYQISWTLKDGSEPISIASVAAVKNSLLTHQGWEELQQSELWQWEKECNLGNITACVGIKVQYGSVEEAILCLRLPHTWSTSMIE